jgi:hypothetical protein
MNRSEWRDLASKLYHGADVMRLPAHPALWPDWMTKEKRYEMATSFENRLLNLEQRANGH